MKRLYHRRSWHYNRLYHPRVSSLIKASIALPALDCLPIFNLVKVRSRVRINSSLLGCPVALFSSTTGLSIFPAVPPVVPLVAIAVHPGLLLPLA